jgi:type II secretory pathway component PulF
MYVAPMQQQMIATGDLSGTLEQSYQRIADEAATQLQGRLELFQMWFVRVTLVIVVYSAVYTVATLYVSARQ